MGFDNLGLYDYGRYSYNVIIDAILPILHLVDMSGHNNNEVRGDATKDCRQVVETFRIAPSMTSEKNDCRAVQSRRRRERPQRIRIDTATKDEIRSLYEPDIDSFVSGCIPGASFATGSSQRRTKMIRPRSLPLLSYLASTQLAAAEKKRKKEQTERLNLIAEEEARKALLLNPIKATSIDHVGDGGGQINSAGIRKSTAGDRCDKPQPEAPIVSIQTEGSNILMPPLLKPFLNQLK